MKLTAFIGILGMLATCFSPIKIQAQDEPSPGLNPADSCINTVLSSSKAKTLTNQINDASVKNNWSELAHAELGLIQIEERCRLIAPHIATYGYQTVARMLVDDAGGYELAASAAYCVRREDLVHIYLAKARASLDAVRREPAEGLATEYNEPPGLEMKVYTDAEQGLNTPYCSLSKDGKPFTKYNLLF
jgi:hypothetical protein